MSKMLFRGHQEPIQQMFNLFLKDGTTVKNNKMRKNRCIVEDDRNKKLLCREVINVLMDYENELKRIFTLYDYDN
jgi:hypothetical protein